MKSRFIIRILLAALILCGSWCCAEATEQEVLNIYFMPSGDNLEDLSMINDLLNQYLQQKMGLTVQLILPERNYHQSIHTDLLQGKQIDLAFCNDAEYLHDWIQNGWLYPLDRLFEEQGAGISSWIADEYMYKENHIIYGIGNNVERGRSFGFEYLVDVARACEVDMSAVHTISDLTEVFAKVKEYGGGIIPTVVLPGYLSPEDILGDNRYGVLMSPQDTTVENLFESDAYWDFLQLVFQWTQSGFTYDKLTDSNSLLYYMSSGRVFGALCKGKPGFAEQESFLTGREIGYVELTPYTLYSNAVNRSYCYVIPKTSKDPEVAMQLLNLLYNDSYIANLLIYGVEGRHYIKSSDFSVIKKPDSQYCGIDGYTYCNQYTAYVFDGAPKTLWEEMMEEDATAPRSTAYGFCFDEEAVKALIMQCDAVYEDYTDLLFSGVVDPTSLRQEVTAAYRAAGIETIIEEKQRQLDLFLEEGTQP